MTAPAELLVNGSVFSGWTEIAVRASLDSIAREFMLTYVAQVEEQRTGIVEGDACTLRTAGGQTPLCGGWVDDVDDHYDGTTQTLSCGGRSTTADLVDCSAVIKGGMWKEATIAQIVDSLLKAFGLSLAQGDVDLTTVLRRFAVQEGETVHECIERLARAHGFLWISTPGGKLKATRAGATRTSTAIERGVNVAKGRRMGSMRERFSTYSVVSQLGGDDSTYGSGAAHIRASADDKGVTRHRPLVIIGDQVGRKGTEARAEWERNVRSGRAHRYSYELLDWNLEEGGVWDINLMTRVRDPYFGLDEDLLVAACELTYGQNGTVTRLELVRPEAYQVGPEPKAPAAKSDGIYQ